MDVQQLLQTAASATVGNEVRADAARQLEQAASEHFAAYMVMLAQALGDTTQVAQDVRMLAALAMKNELSAKNDRDRGLKAQRWAEGPLSSDQKQQIKSIALKSLTDVSPGICASASQLVAAIATIELPRGEWSDLTVLLVSMTSRDQYSTVKKSALTTIGYICESANPADPNLETQMNGFLTAIVQAGNKDEQDQSVRLAAINALSNSLEFIRSNFERENERNLIMMSVCEATQNTTEELQSAAFGCLAKIVHYYYEFMQPYMEQALYALTIHGMQSEHEGVQCMAIEFWSTVSEVEADLQERIEDIEATGSAVPGEEGYPKLFNFIGKALPQILPPILKLLVKEDEDVDEDEWNVVMAAGMCLQLIAKTARDQVLDITMTFVSSNIQLPNWNDREAAVMAFGSVLEGPEETKLLPVVQSSLQPLAAMITDPSLSVRETVAWCLGRVADFVIGAVSSPQSLEILLQAVVRGLQDNPRVITHSCWTIINLSEQLNPIPQESTSLLSPFYETLVASLVSASDRTDNEHSSRTSAYEALSSLMLYSPNDVLPLVMNCSATCNQRLHQSLQMQQQVVSIDDRQNVEELQINLLGLLTNIIRRVESVENQVAAVSDSIMTLLIQFLNSKFPNSLVEDDVFIAIGAVAGGVQEDFAKYVPHLVPYILHALSETELSVSTTAVGLITDITHAINERVAEYTPVFMQELSKILAHFNTIRPELVPPSLACIGDLASAAAPTGQFDIFLPGTEQFLSQIGQAMRFLPEASVESQLFTLSVKEAILDAHVGILAGYHDNPTNFANFVPGVLEFVADLCQDPTMAELSTDSTTRSLVGLIGDIAAMYPQKQFKALFSQPWVTSAITAALTSGDNSTKQIGTYAKREQDLQMRG